MKKWTYTCDKCGREIPEGTRHQLLLHDPEDLKKNMILFEAKYEFDFCQECAEGVMGYITNDAPPLTDRPMETQMSDDSGDAESAASPRHTVYVPTNIEGTAQKPEEKALVEGQQDEELKETENRQQGKKKEGRPTNIDHGKVMALHKAGWSEEAIARDMNTRGVPVQAEQVRRMIAYEEKKEKASTD